MKKKIHIADGYDRIVEEDADGTIHEVKPQKAAKKVVEAKEEAAIDAFAKAGKMRSSGWI